MALIQISRKCLLNQKCNCKTIQKNKECKTVFVLERKKEI